MSSITAGDAALFAPGALARILPACVAVATTERDVGGPPHYAEEAEALGNAVEKRRCEFVTGRACARAALAQLGVPAQPIPVGRRGEPLWPAGVLGSITHCPGYRASAAARRGEVETLGIDAEVDEPLPAGVLADIALAGERRMVACLAQKAPGVSWDRLLFSIKESVYKAWYPLTGRWLGFEDASVAIDPEQGTFTALLLAPGPYLSHGRLTRLGGRWLAADGLLLSAIAPQRRGGRRRRSGFASGQGSGENESAR